MMRNLGGAIGIAALQTFLTKREQFHSNLLNQSVSALEPATRDRVDELDRLFPQPRRQRSRRRRT